MSNFESSPGIQTHDIYPEPSNTQTLTTLSSTNWNGNIMLFFVALGFGILFCNLWVMIGIKYCYKYSSVNRPETIEIQRIMPQNQTCQKKLMTQGEADQKFPSILYKEWQSQHKHRKQQCKNVASVNEPNQLVSNNCDEISFSPKKSDADDVSNEHNICKQKSSYDFSISYHDDTKSEVNKLNSCTDSLSEIPHVIYCNSLLPEHNDVGIYIPDEQQSKHKDEHVNKSEHKSNFSTEFPDDTSYADTCAICLDTFQDDDEIRVLTCGHLYHSSCIVPWFTTRRAMCPLCKYDFYIPKTSTNANVENTSRNIQPFPEAQIYEHLHHSPVILFSTYEPRHLDQYRIPANNTYRNRLYNTESNLRNFISRGISKIPLFRRNHSLI